MASIIHHEVAEALLGKLEGFKGVLSRVYTPGYLDTRPGGWVTPGCLSGYSQEYKLNYKFVVGRCYLPGVFQGGKLLL